MSRIPPQVSEYMATIGAKGGAASRGASKKRSPAHYRKMVKARRKKSRAGPRKTGSGKTGGGKTGGGKK